MTKLPNIGDLAKTLKDNGFKEAAKYARRFAAHDRPHHIKSKLDQWKVWEAAGGWPWPQWDRKSDKDWYAIREQCKW